MTINPDKTLLQAVFDRHSIRSFRPSAPEERIVNALRAEISYASSRDAAIHFQLMLDDSSPFSGITASYGMFRNARNYVACVVDSSYDFHMQRAGFYSAMLAYRAVSRGLGTCFVSGTYNPDKVAAQLRVTWRLPFILLLGYPLEEKTRPMARLMKKMAGSSRRPSPAEMLDKTSMPYEEVCSRWPEMKKAIEGLATAPSSMNRRPVRLCVSQGNTPEEPVVTAICVRNYTDADVDMGIALATWQICAGGEWDFGKQPRWHPDF